MFKTLPNSLKTGNTWIVCQGNIPMFYGCEVGWFWKIAWDSVVQQFNCNSPMLLPSLTQSHPDMHHYRNHFMLQWYLLSHRAKNKWGDCYVEMSHEYMHMLPHPQYVVIVSWWLSAKNQSDIYWILLFIIETDNVSGREGLLSWLMVYVYNSGPFMLLPAVKWNLSWSTMFRVSFFPLYIYNVHS